MIKQTGLFIFSIFTLLASSQAFALPLVQPGEEPSRIGDNQGIWGPNQATTEDLLGMASLYCSGAIVELNRKPQDKAVLLTNGHCVRKQLLGYKEIVVNISYTRSQIALGLNDGMARVHPNLVLYGTMTETDLALIELKESYEELASQGAKIFKISSRQPMAGSKVRVVSGYWKEKQFCTITYQVDKLVEADWTWTGSFALDDDCIIRGGYSGSPVIDESTEEVVAIINTGNENGEWCTMDNPCEVDANGKKQIHQGRGYAQRVNDIMGCVTAEGKVNLTQKDCALYH